jgi:PAS domain S-box-containing protein
MFRIFERSSSEQPLDRRQLLELIHPDDREKHVRAVDEGLRARLDWFVEFRIVLPGRRVKHLHAIGHPIFDESGDVSEWVGAIVDVSERMRVQEDLEQSQLELRNAVEAIPAMAWIAHPDGTNAFVNRRWASYVGMPPDQLSFDAWAEVVHPDDLARCAENWTRCVETGAPFEEQLRLRCSADGRYRWFLDRGVPLIGKDGEVLKWYGIATDIHDRKQTESILAAEKQLLEMIATGAPLDAILRAICLTIEEQQSGASVSILLLNGERTHLSFAAGPSVPDDCALAMASLPVGPNAGPCGTAVHRRAAVIVPDVATDAFWATPFSQMMAHRHSIRASWSTPIFSPKGDVLGTVGIYCREPGGPGAHDSELLRLATYIAGVAIDRDRSEKERDRLRRLESEREAAIAQERSRIAREIHDTLAQGLAMIVMQVADVETKLGSSWALAARPLSTIRDLAVESLAFARRSLNALRLPAGTAGLAAVLQDVVDRLGRHFDGSLNLSVTGNSALIDPAIESALTGIAREALTNAVKHSRAPHVVAELEFMDGGAVRVVVSDDGIGFDASTVRSDAYGLVSMQERAIRAGVVLTFVTEKAAGTTIVASWAPDSSSPQARSLSGVIGRSRIRLPVA